MGNNNSIGIAKKEIVKAIIGEFYKKEVIDFNQYNLIVRKIDEDILKRKRENKIENLKQVVVDIHV